MFTEALAMAPALIGLVVYGALGVVGMVWLLTRTRPAQAVHKSGRRRP